jgi:hypothetical protein
MQSTWQAELKRYKECWRNSMSETCLGKKYSYKGVQEQPVYVSIVNRRNNATRVQEGSSLCEDMAGGGMF